MPETTCRRKKRNRVVEEEDEEDEGEGLSLNTLSPDRINYSDVSICQQVPVAQSGNWELPPNKRERGQMEGLKGRKE